MGTEGLAVVDVADCGNLRRDSEPFLNADKALVHRDNQLAHLAESVAQSVASAFDPAGDEDSARERRGNDPELVTAAQAILRLA